MRFVLRRLLHSLFLLAAASVIAFTLMNLAPGDFYDALRLRPEISARTVAAIRSEHGLARSLPERYLQWLRSVLAGDWGVSLAYNSPARPIVLSRARNTLLLGATATLLAWGIAMPLGLWVAAYPAKWSNTLASFTVSILLATPELVLALLLLLFAVRTGYLPAGGLLDTAARGSRLASVWEEAADLAKHLLLPSVCLAAGLLPTLVLHVRTAGKEALASPFVTAARAYGIPFRRVLLHHVLPAAANPLISLLGLSLGLMMSSSLVVEAIFSWPGLGQLMWNAILERDFFLIVDAVLLAAAFLIAGNLFSDLLLYASDPRIRAK